MMSKEQWILPLVAMAIMGLLFVSMRTETPTVLQHEVTFRRETDRRLKELETELQNVRTRVALLTSFVDIEPAEADNFALRLASELPAISVVKREPVDVGNGITFERFHLRS